MACTVITLIGLETSTCTFAVACAGAEHAGQRSNAPAVTEANALNDVCTVNLLMFSILHAHPQKFPGNSAWEFLCQFIKCIESVRKRTAQPGLLLT
jgi:hypothetical protein